jgi:hypothetical protein
MRRVSACFLPTEILLDIFTTICGDDSDSQDSLNRATIAALARTCRTFKEPALDVLWKDINGFKPLLSCLPSGVVITLGTTLVSYDV